MLNKKHEDFTISDIPMWDFDGSSTGQATGDNSEVLLKPCKIYKNTLKHISPKVSPSSNSPTNLKLEYFFMISINYSFS